MTDNKYTDEDIISSLKIIATTGNCNECKIRNCKWGTCNCEQITANAALDLINRLQSENEELVGNNDKLNIELQSMRSAADPSKMHYEEAQTEIEKLKENRDELWEIHCRDTERCLERIDEIDILKEELKTVKSEAYKECIEKVKEKIVLWEFYDKVTLTTS